MSHEKIKAFFSEAVRYVSSNISQYTVNPDKDLTRVRKLGTEALEAVFQQFNSSVLSSEKPSFSTAEYFAAEGHSAKGFPPERIKLLYYSRWR